MKVYVTGGSGFIGRHVLTQLADAGHEVTALRRGSVEGAFAAVRWSDTLLDRVETSELAGHDAMVHLAAVGISPRVATWAECLRWNVDAAVRLVQQAHAGGVRRVVVAGTFAEYGRSADHFERLPVDAPLLPTNAYAASKAAGFALLHALAIELEIELVYLRVFSAFGEGQHPSNFWPALRSAALAGQDFEMTPGEQVRDYIAVQDVAARFVEAAVSLPVKPGQPLVRNVASGRPITMRAFAEHWWATWGARGRLQVGAKPYRPNEPMRFAADLAEQG